MIYPVILCGGSGTRLWPSSRRAFPKQFAAFAGKQSLFQNALSRLSGPDFDAPVFVTNEDFRFLVEEQAAALGLLDGRIILEPAMRNTAPAVLTAALTLKDQPGALMLVAPSDHMIRDTDGFLASVAVAAKAAQEGALVTFGVAPDRPETGFGYLKLAEPAAAGQAVALSGFLEKPDRQTAAGLLEQDNVLWNAGMFLFRVCDILEAYKLHAPHMLALCDAALAQGEEDLGFFRLGAGPYEEIGAVSIDDAIISKAENVVAVPLASDWSDLGSWDSLHAVSADGPDRLSEAGPVTAISCENTLLRSEEDNIRLVGLGLKNIVAVAMRDAVLVASLDHAQDVKTAVEALRENAVPQAEEYPRFYRPWGWYETLCLGERFQVKRIMVKPGGILSLQSHMHRSEHWIVVAGTAQVTVGETVKLLSENQSVYVPLGAVHRMENTGKVPMYLIEVQTGAYLGEDDIVRYEDVYNRN
ncbi:mannose-1-phosphate guanylyltransferase/mannose-6-phosphate isomerase (plasmid) [Leisingera caerulea]|uniref:mannose-1-phosphate guanylyltransferase n=1 Tax=Leisingera caerulea TaxID=506591 RepID=A0ABY5X3C5_LEICA|nr:mannose-1-phosphate guanylyltransferase/mannose-6-phosphate isomerase [Leisingera caerulea]UWQ61096.1 mannose-1-phosphate guanylyltransferase/mannose-6-phosphate isomerase [Leisingera caerulea]UWQ64777.1 mannose-1-phosphate guanylyltransferase/mannose-6-phosphate isomerase [Leisingera caerulea]UWQ86141.1 mannose-1-phosphate guanylyltransferase/mannose-6-phosphate isomerase [Leisingera caerulea]